MITLSVLYPKGSGSRFDLDYYLQTHVPLVKSRLSDLGLEKLEVAQGTSALDGGTPAFELIAQLTFTSLQQLQEALSRHGGEIIGDIPNFTNIQPIMQIGKPV